ncbi:MAG: alanine racemase [Elusimicrobiota bacterium]|jgi:alanine racemase|nr:alanine racemase [Elusimicrobiota bacterium]
MTTCLKHILRPTYAFINLNALKNNLLKAKKLAAKNSNINPKIMLLVKANAYGHGILQVASYAQKEKLCHAFGVASIEEGVLLRQNNIKLPILVLGSVYPFECFEEALKNNLSITVASVRAAKYIASLAVKLKLTARCHIKQETGMGRIGSRRPAAIEILKILNASKYVVVEGVYSHLSAPQLAAHTKQQLNYFKEFLATAAAQNLKTGLAHIAASPGFLKYKNIGFDMIRLGHLAYGLEDGFEPVLSLHSKVVFIKDVRQNTPVSYGLSYICKHNAKIATIPIGYGDGYKRALSNKADVLIKGKKCPIIGNITMDMLMVDITKLGDIPVGSEVVLIGKQKGQSISAADLAKKASTIDYEILTTIAARVPRITDKKCLKH